MTDVIELAEKLIGLNEFERAETYFIKAFEENPNSREAVIGVIKCKFATAKIENKNLSQIINWMNTIGEYSINEKNDLKNFFAIHKFVYIDSVSKKLIQEANELSKRPTFDGTMFAVKQLSDTTDFMNIFQNIGPSIHQELSVFDEIYRHIDNSLEFVQSVIQIYNKLFGTVANLPMLNGKLALESAGLVRIKISFESWRAKLPLDLRSDDQFKMNKNTGCVWILMVFGQGLLVVSLFLL